MRSRNKKLLVGAVGGGTLATILIIGLFPVFLYGFSVQTVSINYKPFVSMVPVASGPEDSISPSAPGFGSFQFLGGSFQAEHTVMNPYNYFNMKANDNCIGSGTMNIDSLYVSLYFYLTIVNPNGDQYQHIFTLKEIAGNLTVNIVVGPDMIPIVNGTYQIDLFTELTIAYGGTTLFYGNLTISRSVDINL